MLEPEQRKSRELDLNLDSTGWGILEKFPESGGGGGGGKGVWGDG